MKRASCPKPSTQAWILVLSPPRERPRACSPFFRGTGRMLMGTHNGAVEIDLLEVGILAQYLENVLPYLLVGPAGKADINARPWAKLWRQVAPWTTRARQPQYRLDKQAVIRAVAPPVPGLPRTSGAMRSY